MWGLRLGVWKFHARAPPDWSGKSTIFGTKTARTLILMERDNNNNLEGFHLFYFLFFLPSSKHPTPEKAFSILCDPRVAKAIHASLLWDFQGAQSSPTLPSYHHPFKSQQKAGQSLDSLTGCIFFCLFLFFLIKDLF